MRNLGVDPCVSRTRLYRLNTGLAGKDEQQAGVELVPDSFGLDRLRQESLTLSDYQNTTSFSLHSLNFKIYSPCIRLITSKEAAGYLRLGNYHPRSRHCIFPGGESDMTLCRSTSKSRQNPQMEIRNRISNPVSHFRYNLTVPGF